MMTTSWLPMPPEELEPPKEMRAAAILGGGAGSGVRGGVHESDDVDQLIADAGEGLEPPKEMRVAAIL